MTMNRRNFLKRIGLNGTLAVLQGAFPQAVFAQSANGERRITHDTFVRERGLPPGGPLEGFTDLRTGRVYTDAKNSFKFIYCGAANDVFAGEGRKGCGDDLFDMAAALNLASHLSGRDIDPVFVLPNPIAGQDQSLLDQVLKEQSVYQNFTVLSASNKHVARFALMNLASSYGFNPDGSVNFHMRNANLKAPDGKNIAIYRGIFQSATSDISEKILAKCPAPRLWGSYAPGCEPAQ